MNNSVLGNDIILPRGNSIKEFTMEALYNVLSDFIAKNYNNQTTASDFEEIPVSFKEFVQSKDHMDFLPLSERQLSVIDFMLGDNPDKIFTNKNELAILVYGKGSLVGGTEVITSNGIRSSISSLSKNRLPLRLLSLVEGNVIKPALSTPAIEKEIKEECVRVTTAHGHTSECSVDHKFLTINGWTKAKDLKVGSLLATPRILSISGKNKNIHYNNEPIRLPIEALFQNKKSRLQYLIEIYKKHASILITTASPYTIKFSVPTELFSIDLDFLLKTFGIHARLTHTFKKNIHRYYVIIEAQSMQKKFATLLRGVDDRRLMEIRQYAVKSDKHVSALETISKNIIWERVTEITSIGYHPVYTFTVPGAKNYYQGGFLHHNSGKDTLCVLILCYICYVLLCMRSPQRYFRMPEGEFIDAVNVAPSEKKANTIFFEKLRQRLFRWRWLKQKYPVRNSGAFISQLKPSPGDPFVTVTKDGVIFPKLIRLLARSSDNESAEGLNTLVYLMDEACFTGPQQVVLESGKKLPIATIVNDKLKIKVLSYNKEKNSIEAKYVTNWYKYSSANRTLIKLTFKNNTTITVTDNHRIYTSMGLVRVKDLVLGSIVYFKHDSTIVKSTLVSYELCMYETDFVYDIEIEDNHNYFVNGLLVSNSAFSDKSNNRNAYKLFKVLRSSSKTRFGDKGKGFIISYPRSKQDFTMEMYKRFLPDLHTYTDKAATWEVKPLKYFSGSWFDFEGKRIPLEYRNDFEHFPTESKMMYLAEPPNVEYGFIEYPDKISDCLTNAQASVAVEDFVRNSKICKRILSVADTIRRDIEYVVTVDLGKKADAAALGIYHRIDVNNKAVIVQDLITSWIPDPSQKFEVSFENVYEFIKELSFKINIIGVWFDQWQSIYLRERLIQANIQSHEYFLHYEDYKNFKELLYSKRLVLLADKILVKEIKELKVVGQRVDHPSTKGGSKDRLDTLAGAIKIFLEKYSTGAANDFWGGELEFIDENLGKEEPW